MPITPIANRLRGYGLILPAILLSGGLAAQALNPRPVKGPVPSWVQPFSYDTSVQKHTFVFPYRGKREGASEAEPGNRQDIVPETGAPVYGMTPEETGMDLGGDPAEQNP